MDFLKSLFESGALTWEQFSEAVKDKSYKLADLSKGDYVSSKKHEDELNVKDATIKDLNGQIATRDTDIEGLKNQLADVGTDSEGKIKSLSDTISKLQGDYETVKTDYEARLGTQSYEFAVREFANSKQFTSKAAKRDFINEMISENLKMKDKSILGAEDFVTAYSEANEDAFGKQESTKKEPETKPAFVAPKTTQTPAGDDNAFLSAFNFSGVRPKESK